MTDCPPIDNLAFEKLKQKVPKSVESDLPKQRHDSSKAIQEINENATSTLMEVLHSSEEARIKQQKPLQISLLVFVGIQLLFFNGIIGFLVVHSCQLDNQSITANVLEFLKYYVGAVLVELIGMIMFITKSKFTSPAQDIIKGFFSRKQ